MPLEKDLESRVRKYAKDNGVLCYKFVSPGNGGVPDRVLIGPGGTVFLELKKKGKDLRPLQKYTHELMRKHGARVFWADSFEGAKAVVDAIL